MISKILELLLAHLVVLLGCFPFKQSTQVPNLVNSRVFKTLSFTNILILSMEMCHNLLCHNKVEFSFIRFLFVPTLVCNDNLFLSKLGSRSILNKLSILIPPPIKFPPLKILKVEFMNKKPRPTISNLETEIKFLEKHGMKNTLYKSKTYLLFKINLKVSTASTHENNIFFE
jgi:hypothetical protein